MNVFRIACSCFNNKARLKTKNITALKTQSVMNPMYKKPVAGNVSSPNTGFLDLPHDILRLIINHDILSLKDRSRVLQSSKECLFLFDLKNKDSVFYLNQKLLCAIHNQFNISFLKALLKYGADPNQDVTYPDGQKVSVLALVIINGYDTSLINALFEKRSHSTQDSVYSDFQLDFMLALAVMTRCNVSLVRLLLNKGASPKKEICIDEPIQTVLMAAIGHYHYGLDAGVTFAKFQKVKKDFIDFNERRVSILTLVQKSNLELKKVLLEHQGLHK